MISLLLRPIAAIRHIYRFLVCRLKLVTPEKALHTVWSRTTVRIAAPEKNGYISTPAIHSLFHSPLFFVKVQCFGCFLSRHLEEVRPEHTSCTVSCRVTIRIAPFEKNGQDSTLICSFHAFFIFYSHNWFAFAGNWSYQSPPQFHIERVTPEQASCTLCAASPSGYLCRGKIGRTQHQYARFIFSFFHSISPLLRENEAIGRPPPQSPC